MKKIKEELKQESPKVLWEAARDNFIYGFIGASIIVAVTLKMDIAVLLVYLGYYFFLGKVVNRPKYTTSLGKFIMFPIPSAVGAFTGYKLSNILIIWLTSL